MERNMELIREILLDIEKNANPGQFYNVLYSIKKKHKDDSSPYNHDYIWEHLNLLEEAGMLGKTAKNLNGGFQVSGLSNAGYDFLETIRNEKIWRKTKEKIKKERLPSTIKYIAEVAGAFLGSAIKNMMD